MSARSTSSDITLARSFVEKIEVHENAGEGWGHGVGGTLSGSDPFLLSDGPWALPTAKLPAPFQGACPHNGNLAESTNEARNLPVHLRMYNPLPVPVINTGVNLYLAYWQYWQHRVAFYLEAR
jgi:hypothetical protein